MGSARIDMQENLIRVKKLKPRNPLIEELFEGKYSPRREEPKTVYNRKDKYQSWKHQTTDDDSDYDDDDMY